jgi:hypothetical protein
VAAPGPPRALGEYQRAGGTEPTGTGSAYDTAEQREGKNPPTERGSGRRVKKLARRRLEDREPPRIKSRPPMFAQPNTRLIHGLSLATESPRGVVSLRHPTGAPRTTSVLVGPSAVGNVEGCQSTAFDRQPSGARSTRKLEPGMRATADLREDRLRVQDRRSPTDPLRGPARLRTP